MALQCCMKKSALQCLERQFWRVAILSHSPSTDLHLVSSSPSILQRRCYQKFTRIPLEVRAAKKDQGKMLIGDYVDKTTFSVNKEVLVEAEMIAKLTQTQGENKSRTENLSAESSHDADLGVDKEDYSIPNKELHYDASSLKRHNHKDTEDDANESTGSGRKPPFVHPDPLLSKALKAIHSESFSSAFGKYRTLLSQCATTKLREENDLLLLEGPRLIREAFLSGMEPVAVYQSRQKLLLDMMPQHMSLQEKVQRIQTLKTFKTPYKMLSTWSSVVKGQGLLGVFRLSAASSAPRLHLNEEHSTQVAAVTPVTVVLDGVREPGNLGAIIRTIAAIGAHHVVLMKGCCDPWEGKALRSGCGAHFSLRITRNVTWDSVYGYVPPYPNVFVADVCNSDREAMKVPEGDEGYEEEEYDETLQEEQEQTEPDGERELDQRPATRSRDERTTRHQSERRGRFYNKYAFPMEKKEEKAVEDDSIDKTGVIVGMDEEGNEILIDNSFNDEEHVKEYSNVRLPTKYYNEHLYYPPNLNRSEAASVVLVIGSETGLSNWAKKFAVDNFGHQVSVPLHSGMDSLNTSVASGIILYELWNQAQKQLPAVVEAAAVKR